MICNRHNLVFSWRVWELLGVRTRILRSGYCYPPEILLHLLSDFKMFLTRPIKMTSANVNRPLLGRQRGDLMWIINRRRRPPQQRKHSAAFSVDFFSPISFLRVTRWKPTDQLLPKAFNFPSAVQSSKAESCWEPHKQRVKLARQ